MDWKWADAQMLQASRREQGWLYSHQTKQTSSQRGKQSHDVMTKQSIRERDGIFINVYAPKTRAPNYVKQILVDLKGTDSNTVAGRDFYVPLQQ